MYKNACHRVVGLTSIPRSVAKSSFCRGMNTTSGVSVDQNDPMALVVLVGVEGTVTGGDIGLDDDENEEDATIPPLVVKGVTGMEVEDGGGPVLEVTELPSVLEKAMSPPLTQRPLGDTTNGG